MKRHYSTRRVVAIRTTAKPSQFISFLADVLPRSIMIYARASTWDQKNLPEQENTLAEVVSAKGFRVISAFSEIGHGYDPKRIEFERAILAARKHGCPLVAESVNRFMRTRVGGWRQPLTVFDMEDLMRRTEGVQLVTLVDPDATENEQRSHQTKRGISNRPKVSHPKKQKRINLKPKAVAMRRKGCSWGEIASRLNVSRSTVRGWINGANLRAIH